METGNAAPVNGPNKFEAWVQNWVLRYRFFWWIMCVIGAAIALTGFYPRFKLGEGNSWNLGRGLFFASVVVLPFALPLLKVYQGKVLHYRRQFKACGVFISLLVIFFYTYFSRRGEEQEQRQRGYGDILSLAGFAVMNFVLSLQKNYQFVEELMKFFLVELVVELTVSRWWFGFLGAMFSFLLIILSSCKEKHADSREEPSIDNITISVPEARMELVSPTSHDLTRLWNLNDKDQEFVRQLRRIFVTYINGWKDRIPELTMESQILTFDRTWREMEFLALPKDGMTSMRQIEMYSRNRREFLKLCKSELRPDRTATQMSTIKKCIKHFTIVFKVLIPNEQVFYHGIFGTSPFIKQCFMEFCSDVKKELVRAVHDEMSELMYSYEVFLTFQAIREFTAMWRALFPEDVSMLADMVELERKLGETTRDYFFREEEVPSEIGTSYSCEVHPITAQAMNRLHSAFKDKKILKSLLQTYPNGEVEILTKRKRLISRYIYWNINKLEASLESSFKKTYVYQLQGVSLMTNIIYIVKKAVEFEFDLSKEEDWAKEQILILERCFNQYYRHDPTELLDYFRQHNAKATGDKMLSMLDILKFVPSAASADVLRVKLIPNCEEFIKRFRALLAGDEGPPR
ncbi:uncharacterized protein [Arachis hypogaea]|uniref:uncharacterized protein n=1 Tax=Arachis hypogaea TaxID=3818 RepID=UPI000DECD7B3|nr:uncharacterized protein LOC112726695 [Arachis hypogaea]